MYIYSYIYTHIYIYMAVSHLFSNRKNSKDRQHTNFGKCKHGCKHGRGMRHDFSDTELGLCHNTSYVVELAAQWRVSLHSPRTSHIPKTCVHQHRLFFVAAQFSCPYILVFGKVLQQFLPLALALWCSWCLCCALPPLFLKSRMLLFLSMHTMHTDHYC